MVTATVRRVSRQTRRTSSGSSVASWSSAGSPSPASTRTTRTARLLRAEMPRVFMASSFPRPAPIRTSGARRRRAAPRLPRPGGRSGGRSRPEAPAVDPGLEEGGGQDQHPPGESPGAGGLAMDDPGPDRVEHRLQQEEERRLEGRDLFEPAQQEDVGEGDLGRPQVDEEGEVLAVQGRKRGGEGEAEEGAEHVAAQRIPIRVKAQKRPETRAAASPRIGFGAVSETWSTLTKKRPRPTAITPM